MKSNSKGFAPILIFVLVALIGFLGYFEFQKYFVTPQPVSEVSTKPVNTPTPFPDIDAINWKLYKNDDFGFSFVYPTDWYITPSIISKEKFDKGDYSHGDFSGFIFDINSKKDVEGGLSPGGIEVSFYKRIPGYDQRNSRPVDCKVVKMDNTEFSCVIDVYPYEGYNLYIETKDYVFDLRIAFDYTKATKPVKDYSYSVGSKIIKSFRFTH